MSSQLNMMERVHAGTRLWIIEFSTKFARPDEVEAAHVMQSLPQREDVQMCFLFGFHHLLFAGVQTNVIWFLILHISFLEWSQTEIKTLMLFPLMYPKTPNHSRSPVVSQPHDFNSLPI